MERTTLERRQDAFERQRLETFHSRKGDAPWQALGDTYTLCGHEFAGESARERSVYNVTFRRSPAKAWPDPARDDRLVLYGMTDFVRECLAIPEAIDPANTRDVERFMKNRHACGGRLNFDSRPWDDACSEFGGNLPIRIEGLPDGSTFYPGEPVIQVTSLGDGYGEFAALVEATLLGMVSCATARATVTRHLLERMRDEVRKNHPGWDAGQVDAIARNMIHDFGMRASSTPLEAEIFGRAHLLSFDGTDTASAAFDAWCHSEGDLEGIGTSILAHAHRIILGHDTEEDAVRSLADAAERCGDLPIASFLCDTYNTKTFVEKLAIPLALEYKRRGRGCVVVRPDSGDYLENIEYLVDEAHKHDLFEPDRAGKSVATHFRFLLGDSMTPAKIQWTFETLRNLGCNSVGWCTFGIGGWLRAQGNRDVLSAAYKLSAKGLDDEPVVKLSETIEKMSVPGPNVLVRWPNPHITDRPTTYLTSDPILDPSGYDFEFDRPPESAYVTYYDGGARDADEAIGEACFDSFERVRGRASSDFDEMPGSFPQVLSPEIRRVQNSVFESHRP